MYWLIERASDSWLMQPAAYEFSFFKHGLRFVCVRIRDAGKKCVSVGTCERENWEPRCQMPIFFILFGLFPFPSNKFESLSQRKLSKTILSVKLWGLFQD